MASRQPLTAGVVKLCGHKCCVTGSQREEELSSCILMWAHKAFLLMCVCVHVCVLQKMCHSDLSVLFNEMAGEGLLWLPGVGVTLE